MSTLFDIAAALSSRPNDTPASVAARIDKATQPFDITIALAVDHAPLYRIKAMENAYAEQDSAQLGAILMACLNDCSTTPLTPCASSLPPSEARVSGRDLMLPSRHEDLLAMIRGAGL